MENEYGNPPDKIVRIQVTSTQTMETFFVRAVGRDEFTVNVNGSACLGGYGLGVLGMGVPLNLKKNISPDGTTVAYHRIYNADGSLVATTDATWGNWNSMKGRSIFLPIASDDDLDGSHVAWLSWKGATDNATLAAAMTYPSTLQDGFVEGPVADATLPNTRPLKRLSLGDWVAGKTGLPSTLAAQLTQLKIASQAIGLPIYDTAGTVSGKTTFHVVKMGIFRVVDSTLTSGSTSVGSNFVKLEYLGDKSAVPTECAGEPGTPNKKFKISGDTTVDAIWGAPKQTSTTTYDFILVMDTSDSMNRDWSDLSTGTSGYTGPRLNDAKRVLKDFVRNYDVAADPDARMSLITFSGGAHGESAAHMARVVSDWSTSGRPDDTVITPTLCTDDMKWAPLQSASAAITASGYTPGPVAFETIETALKNTRTPPAGKAYQQVVVFATDGVFNVCGSAPTVDPSIEQQPCPYGYIPANDQSNNPDYMIVPGRPIWQAQQVAKRIKETGVPIFVIAVTPRCTTTPTHACFETKGVPDIASGTDYYFEADDPAAPANI